jgi:hypothetical protein
MKSLPAEFSKGIYILYQLWLRRTYMLMLMLRASCRNRMGKSGPAKRKVWRLDITKTIMNVHLKVGNNFLIGLQTISIARKIMYHGISCIT